MEQPQPDPPTSTCLLCDKEVIWWGGTPHDYCSSWCAHGDKWMRSLRAELKRGRDAIDQAAEDADWQTEQYAQQNAIDAQIGRNIKALVMMAYNGVRNLDNLKFHEWS